MIFVNFKTYQEGAGKRAVQLAGFCQEVARKKKIEIIPVVQMVDLFRVVKEVEIPVWVQHLDWQPQGQWTGWLNLEAVVAAGASGTILNHSEHKLPPGTIKRTIKRVENCKFATLVCCRSLGQAEKLVKFKPDFLAYEPPELIGGEISVSQAEPRAISHFVEICGPISPLVGAGIKNVDDLKVALKLGVKGILVASGVVLAKDPKKKLIELASGFKK